MKIKKLVALLLILTGAYVYSQAAQNNEEDTKKKDAMPLKGGSLYDDRFGIENFSFYKKYASNGKGEILEMYFDLVNHTDNKMDFKVFIFGICERNKVSKEREFKGGYPKWRKRDFEKEAHIIHNFHSIPSIDKEKVKEWAIDTRIRLNEKRDEKEKLSLNKEAMQENYDVKLIDYISYAEENIETGIDVTLRGNEESLETAKTSIGGSGYQMFQNPRKTTIISHLFSKFRKDYSYFNRIGLIIYDKELKKVVYRQFFRIDADLKIR